MKRSISLFILCLLFSSITVSAIDNPLSTVKNPTPSIPHIISSISIDHIKWFKAAGLYSHIVWYSFIFTIHACIGIKHIGIQTKPIRKILFLIRKETKPIGKNTISAGNETISVRKNTKPIGIGTKPIEKVIFPIGKVTKAVGKMIFPVRKGTKPIRKMTKPIGTKIFPIENGKTPTKSTKKGSITIAI